MLRVLREPRREVAHIGAPLRALRVKSLARSSPRRRTAPARR